MFHDPDVVSGQPGLRSVPTLPGLAVYEGHLQGQLHTLREGIREFSDIIFYQTGERMPFIMLI